MCHIAKIDRHPSLFPCTLRRNNSTSNHFDIRRIIGLQQLLASEPVIKNLNCIEFHTIFTKFVVFYIPSPDPGGYLN